MLVLSRKDNEEILIGDSIRIRVCKCSSNKTKIGVEAPPDVPVVRGELDRRESRDDDRD